MCLANASDLFNVANFQTSSADEDSVIYIDALSEYLHCTMIS